MENLTNNEIEIIRECLLCEILELENYIKKECLNLDGSDIVQLQEQIEANNLIRKKLAR
jgi:hypothetical protein